MSETIKTSPRKLEAFQDTGLFILAALGLSLLESLLSLSAEYQGFMGIIGSFVVVLLILRMRKQPILGLGLEKPGNLKWLPVWVLGIMLTTVFFAASAQFIVTQYFESTIDLSKFESLYQNLPMLLFAIVSVWITAAFFEEVVYRGFLLGRLLIIFGSNIPGMSISILFHSLLFGALHAYQGISGIFTTATISIVFGIFFLIQKRNLWSLILVHGIIDTLGILQFYLFGLPQLP